MKKDIFVLRFKKSRRYKKAPEFLLIISNKTNNKGIIFSIILYNDEYNF